jgi:hypothetical protein
MRVLLCSILFGIISLTISLCSKTIKALKKPESDTWITEWYCHVLLAAF